MLIILKELPVVNDYVMTKEVKWKHSKIKSWVNIYLVMKIFLDPWINVGSYCLNYLSNECLCLQYEEFCVVSAFLIWCVYKNFVYTLFSMMN